MSLNFAYVKRSCRDGARVESAANESVEFFGVFFGRREAAAVEDFKRGARVLSKQFGSLLKRIGRVLFAPHERDGLRYSRKGFAYVRVQIA